MCARSSAAEWNDSKFFQQKKMFVQGSNTTNELGRANFPALPGKGEEGNPQWM